MKPNIEQERQIEQVLRSALKFKDTYDEVYDHILSAFDVLPDGVHFADALHSIIAYDFGGVKGLKSIERKHIWFSIRQFIKDYLKALLTPLTSVIIIFIMAGTGLFYYLIASGWLNALCVQVIITFIPLSVFGIAVYKFRQHVKHVQSNQRVMINYIRHTIIAFGGNIIIFLPTFLLSTTNIICHKLKYDQIPPSVYAIVFVVVILHTFASYKMYTVNTGMNIK